MIPKVCAKRPRSSAVVTALIVRTLAGAGAGAAEGAKLFRVSSISVRSWELVDDVGLLGEACDAPGLVGDTERFNFAKSILEGVNMAWSEESVPGVFPLPALGVLEGE